MTPIRKSLSLGILLSLAAVAAGPAQSQALPAAAAAHLEAARMAVAGGKAWMYGPLIMCYPDQNRSTQQILKTPPPTKVFDNLYFLGMGEVSAWAIKTSDGIILIDTLNNASDAQNYILGGMAKLGLDPATIKYIVVTHGHGDHYGGAHFLQDKYPQAKVLMSAVDYDLAEKAAAGPRGRGVPAPRRDIAVTDGQVLALGKTKLTMYITPGHSPGTLSLILPVTDHGTPHILSMWGGSASAFLDADYHAKYDASIKRFAGIARAAHADGIFANHAPLDDAAGKIEHIVETPDAPNPYIIGADEVAVNYKIFEECNLFHATSGKPVTRP